MKYPDMLDIAAPYYGYLGEAKIDLLRDIIKNLHFETSTKFLGHMLSTKY